MPEQLWVDQSPRLSRSVNQQKRELKPENAQRSEQRSTKQHNKALGLIKPNGSHERLMLWGVKWIYQKSYSWVNYLAVVCKRGEEGQWKWKNTHWNRLCIHSNRESWTTARDGWMEKNECERREWWAVGVGHNLPLHWLPAFCVFRWVSILLTPWRRRCWMFPTNG